MTTSRWWDWDIGDDPVTRQTTAVANDKTVVSVLIPGTNQVIPGTSQPDVSSITTTAPVKTISQDSGIAPFETLFHDFRLQAEPVYNFWEPAEESSTPARGNQSLEELPRYIHLTWERSPTIQAPDDIRRRAASTVADAHDQYTQLSPFGFGSHAVVGTTVNGVSFTPPQFQPEGFQENVAKVANGYIFSGIVEGVSTVKTGSVTLPPKPTSMIIDEDEYLLNWRTWWGIPYWEYVAALWRRYSRTYTAQQTIYRSNSRLLDIIGATFSVAPRLGNYALVATAGNCVSYYGVSAASQRYTLANRIEELGQGIFTDRLSHDSYHNVKVKLIHTNFGGILVPERVNGCSQPHHAESVIAIGQNAADLAAYSNAGWQHYARDVSIPSEPAPDTLKQNEYIGYVIEKYENISGSYNLVKTIYVPGRDYDSYDDTEVKYGTDYRYRMKGIMRWVRPRATGVLGSTDSTGSVISSMTPNLASYFHTEWAHEWAYAHVIDESLPPPPDELVVMPHSEPHPDTGRPYVVVSFKLPYNPQRDINKITLFRKLQDEDGEDLTDWTQLQEFKETLDDPTRQGTRTLYTSNAEHEQDDLTGTKFNVEETQRVETFVEYGPSNGRFEDYDVEYWGTHHYRYVYAAVCYTRHGEQSLMSDQVACRLNPKWRKEGEFLNQLVSCAGVDMGFDTGIFATYPEKRLRSEVVFKPNLKTREQGVVGLSGQERTAARLIDSTTYIMRVESLDTGEHIDVPVNLTVQNQPSETQVLPYDVLTQS